MSRIQLKLGKELGRGSEGCIFEIVGTSKVCKVLTTPYQEGVLPNELIMHDLVFNHDRRVEPCTFEPQACHVHMNGQTYYGLILDRACPIRYPMYQDDFPVADFSSSLLAYLKWAIRILSALQSSAIVHGDIKHGNIMKDLTNGRWLIDFGVAQTYEAFQRSTTDIGTLSICAPEYLAGNRQYPFQADVWAMGKFLIGLLGLSDIFTLLQEGAPNSAGALSAVAQKIGCFESLDEELDLNEIAAALQAERDKLTPGMGFFPMFFQIIGQMLSIHPALRPSITDLASASVLLREECVRLAQTKKTVSEYLLPNNLRECWIAHLRLQYGMDSLKKNLPFENIFHDNRSAAASAEQEVVPVAPAVGSHVRFAFAGQGQNRDVEIEYFTIHPLQMASALAASSAP